ALGHAQLGHDVAQILALDVDRARRAHLPRQRKPVVVDVGDDDMTRTDVAGDRGRHDADWARAGDQNVLADQVERQRGVRCVAKRIEDRRQVVRDIVRNLERVESGDHQVFGECALAIDADADGIAAQVTAPGAAVAAEAAGDVAFARYAVADREAAHFLAHVDDLADVLMTDVHRHRNRLARPLVPVPDMHVGAADRCLADAYHHVVVADLGFFHLSQLEARRGFELGECLHRFSLIAPSALPTFAKAAIARSIWSAVCAALIWVRMRALPFGTTGYEN